MPGVGGGSLLARRSREGAVVFRKHSQYVTPAKAGAYAESRSILEVRKKARSFKYFYGNSAERPKLCMDSHFRGNDESGENRKTSSSAGAGLRRMSRPSPPSYPASVPGIQSRKRMRPPPWIAGTGPAMTGEERVFRLIPALSAGAGLQPASCILPLPPRGGGPGRGGTARDFPPAPPIAETPHPPTPDPSPPGGGD